MVFRYINQIDCIVKCLLGPKPEMSIVTTQKKLAFALK